MNRLYRYYGVRDWWQDYRSIVFMIVVLIIVIGLLIHVGRKQFDNIKECEKAGGVWFTDEGKCLDVKSIPLH